METRYGRAILFGLLALLVGLRASGAVINPAEDVGGRISVLEIQSVGQADLDGDWFYPDWFQWTFSKVSDAVPDATSILTNKDVVVSRRQYSAEGSSWEIAYSGVRSAAFAPPAVISAHPSVATTTVAKVWYVAPGTCTVTATIGDFSRTTNLVVSLSSITNDVVVGCVTGSAAYAFTAAISARMGDGSDKAVFSAQDHVATNYVRNPDSWVADINLTCISPWNSTGGRQRAGTLIGADCILFADHFPIAPGATVRFVTASNTVVSRTMISSRKSFSDFRIGRLSASVLPDGIVPALLCPENQADFIPYRGSYSGTLLQFWIDQYEAAYAGYHVSDDGIFPLTTEPGVFYAKGPIVGDSGSPILRIAAATNRVILVGTMVTSLGGYCPVFMGNAQIRADAAALGCDTDSITDADFNAMGFTNFNPGPPKF
jgi:hypothetical protein